MQFSDLHIHSNFSDGLLAPRDIVYYAIRSGIKCISITDHDTIDSQYEIDQYFRCNEIIAIPGIELSTEYKNREVHILGYFIDIENNNIKQTLNEIKQTREDRAKLIVDKLNNLGIDLVFEEIETSKQYTAIGRMHIAKLLVEKGIVRNSKEAFQKFLIQDKPAYVQRTKINYKKALSLILEAGGVPVLAHPGELYKGLNVEEIVREFKVYGLRGIEVFHPAHDAKKKSQYYNLATKYSLLISGGSDCHGTLINDSLQVGSVGLNEKLTYKFLNACNRK